MSYLKETFNIYVQHFWKITLLSITTCLPFLLLHAFASNQIYFYVSHTPAEIFGDFSNLLLIMVYFVIVQIPFIRLVQGELNEEENLVKLSYQTFLEYGFSAFLFAFLYIFLVVFGITLFIIPGIAILIFFYLTPFVMIYKRTKAFRSIGMAFKLARKHFFKILLILLAMCLIDYLLSSLLLMAISNVTTNYLSIFFSQLLLNLILFPLFTIFTTCHFHDWYEEMDDSVGEESILLRKI